MITLLLRFVYIQRIDLDFVHTKLLYIIRASNKSIMKLQYSAHTHTVTDNLHILYEKEISRFITITSMIYDNNSIVLTFCWLVGWLPLLLMWLCVKCLQFPDFPSMGYLLARVLSFVSIFHPQLLSFISHNRDSAFFPRQNSLEFASQSSYSVA